MKIVKRILLVILSLLVLGIVLIAVFISPVIKYEIEKNSVAWIGRQVTLKDIRINLLNGSVNITDFKINEAHSSEPFFQCHDFYINVTLKKLLKKEYEINALKLDAPVIYITQNGNHFNFDDLIKRFSSAPTKPVKNAPPVHYFANKLQITNGTVKYNNVPMHNLFDIHNININCPQFTWNNNNATIHTDFKYGSGGDFDINFAFNRATLNYHTTIDILNYDLSQYYTPLRTMMKITALNGTLSTHFKIQGNLNDPKDIAASGKLFINNLHIKDSVQDEVFAIKELAVHVDSINVKNNFYNFARVDLVEPFFKFDLYDNGNNISRMIVSTGPPAPVDSADAHKYDYTNVFTMMTSYVKDIAANYIVSNYSADSLVIHNGHLVYSDYTLNDEFHYNLDSINIQSGKISAANKRIEILGTSVLNKTGNLVANISVSPDFKDMDIDYTINDMRMADLNPYFKYYVATPFWDGIVKYQSSNSVVNHFLKSKNTLYITKVEVGKKTRTKGLYNLPMRLAIALLKDAHGDINLDIPVEGDLKDPKYKLSKVIWAVLKNIIEKAAAEPVHLLSHLFGKKEEDLKQVSFWYMQKQLEKEQEEKLEDIYKVLEKKKELNLELVQVSDSEAEEDKLAVFAAKKQYYFQQLHHSSLNDSTPVTEKELKAIHEIATQDTSFNKYLNAQLHLAPTDLMPVADKCIKLIGEKMLNNQVHIYMQARNTEVLEFFTKKKKIDINRVHVRINKDPALWQDLPRPVFNVNYKADEEE